MTDRMIYFFGPGATEGDPTRRDLLGGKGTSLAAMSSAPALPPCPQASPSPSPAASTTTSSTTNGPKASKRELRTYIAPPRANHRPQVRRRTLPAARLRSLRRRTLHARHDGHHPQLRTPPPGLADLVPSPERFWTVYAQFARQFAVTVAHIPGHDFEEIAHKIAATAPAPPTPRPTLSSNFTRRTLRPAPLPQNRLVRPQGMRQHRV